MWIGLLDRMLDHIIQTGDLHVTMPDGSQHRYGDGTAPLVNVTFHDPGLPQRMIRNPDMALGEGYMDGSVTIEDDDLYGLLTLAISNLARQRSPIWWQRPFGALRRSLRFVQQFNPVGKARANVAHHYDLSGELYDLFLDQDRQYSCAYFRHPGETLEQAQIDKKHHIAGKLLIEPDMRVLDIGCGWGGMALTLARDYGARVVGVTLSREQHAVATARAERAGLSGRVDFRLMDYRHVAEKFDRIVSVGMFEHVGAPHFREYFNHVNRMLNPDGVALIHTIGRAGPPNYTSPWINKYIFPGGYIPAMSETMSAVEKERLYATDVEVWRLHYAETLKHWHDRFMANIDKARALYDDRFCRMWRYYLIASELTFRLNGQVVFQFQLAHRQQAVPLTRDYLYLPEQASDMRHAAE
ncbi:MAG: cyclopropane-fatty-acyl-phospholipid synthase family protein [Paracoccaceae bacterium]